MKLRSLSFVFVFFFFAQHLTADDGYRLWLRYDRITDQSKIKEYQSLTQAWLVEKESPTLQIAKQEFTAAMQGLLGSSLSYVNDIKQGTVVAVNSRSPILTSFKIDD